MEEEEAHTKKEGRYSLRVPSLVIPGVTDLTKPSLPGLRYPLELCGPQIHASYKSNARGRTPKTFHSKVPPN